MFKFSNIICSFITLFFLTLTLKLKAQNDSLPGFSVTERSGWVVIGWNNPFPEITQLIIQRSNDSTTGFRSIMAMPDPTAVSNGFVDKKGGTGGMFYRIFYVLPGGRYAFTASKKPLQMITEQKTTVDTKDTILATAFEKLNPRETFESVKKIALIESVGRKDGKEILDKGNSNLKITGTDSLAIFQPSAFIFSNEEGNLILLLPDAEKRHYHLHVFREDGTAMFKMKNIKERHLTVDRSNFYQSGWFRFELYDGELLKEKNRFFIPPEGR